MGTATEAPVQRARLAEFLRGRREATDPVTVGLRPLGRRRTPGLRREEVAQLAGISVTLYTWLEQGRAIGVSRQVLTSLARELRLDPVERDHLFTLAGLAPAPGPPIPGRVDDTVRRLVETLDPHPAYVVNPWWDLLVCNGAYSALLGPAPDGDTSAVRNILWTTFVDRATRDLLVDWDRETEQLAGQLRSHVALHPDDPRGPELVERLTRASRRFADLWALRTVAAASSVHKRLRHPRVGLLDLDTVKLATTGTISQDVIVLLPSDEATREALARLVEQTGAPAGDSPR